MEVRSHQAAVIKQFVWQSAYNERPQQQALRKNVVDPASSYFLLNMR
jgi:hypothetical protein